MSDIRVPVNLFSGDQIKSINEALNKLFGVFLKKEGDDFVLTESIIVLFLKEMPQIRKWQIIATISIEEKFRGEGITLNKSLIRDKVRNNGEFLGKMGFCEDEIIKILEDIAFDFLQRAFKKEEKK